MAGIPDLLPGDPTVLFVDDEKAILSALQRTLRHEPYSCLFTDNADKAMALLRERPVHVVVSDMRMPETSGARFLARVQQQCPDAIRLILSGMRDSQSILRAINDGQVYRYIVKPWDERELKITVRQALELSAVRQERRSLMAQLEAHNKTLEQTVARRTERLLALGRQAEIGKYASQIVHNLNNPLHALYGALDLVGLLLSQAGDGVPPQIDRAMDMARRSVDDLQRIVSGILAHARDERQFHMEVVDVNQVIAQELEYFNLNPTFRYKIQKDIALAPTLPTIAGSRVQIKQIVDNLVTNAVDAMERAPRRILGVRTQADEQHIVIEIRDTGEGIAPDDLPSIFAPDFSTKPVGKGTGLGLASVKTMVAAYAGDIQVSSVQGEGTVFCVRLPHKSGQTFAEAQAGDPGGSGLVDAGRHVAGAEAVVDVDHGHVGAATVEHAEQRGQAAQ